MDLTDLHCNSLRCRKVLSESAVVTSCSHIFCVTCATGLFASNRQTCPACEAPLTEADDVVQTSLTPSNAFKTTALAGMSPALIVDVASRALNFWQYQQGQESHYQALVLKHSQEKVNVLEKQCRSIISEANDEISILRDKLTASERDLESERRKVRDLSEQQKENQRDYQKLKSQYDKAKQRAMLAPISTNAAAAHGPSLTTPMPAHTAQHHHHNAAAGGNGFWEAQQRPPAPTTTSQRPMPFRQTPAAANFGNLGRGGTSRVSMPTQPARGFRPASLA